MLQAKNKDKWYKKWRGGNKAVIIHTPWIYNQKHFKTLLTLQLILSIQQGHETKSI